MNATADKIIKGEFLCVVCPNGCAIDAEFSKGPPARLIAFEGAQCKRGNAWIVQEIETPMRTIASNVPVAHGDYIAASVRTSRPIPLEAVPAVMDAIRATRLEAPVRIGQVVIAGPAGTDTDIIATRNVLRV
jgi:CxxC motif-containing protein